MPWDSPLGPVTDLLTACAEGAAAPAGDSLDVTRLVVETPIELQTSAADDETLIRVAPPRQAIETTVMPVLHRLRVVLEPGP